MQSTIKELDLEISHINEAQLRLTVGVSSKGDYTTIASCY